MRNRWAEKSGIVRFALNQTLGVQIYPVHTFANIVDSRTKTSKI